MMAPDDGYEISQTDPDYPKGLLDLDNPPKRLYVRGDIDVLSLPSISIIGTRSPTPYGLTLAKMAATASAQSGVVVVSGGARGCDHAAGEAALNAGGIHIAVLGCGADVVYPKSSKRLLSRILSDGGAIVSLDPWGTPPRKYAFPRRNRIIAALSSALCVVEAGMPSGTFGTAECAMDLGRELLAVPGSIYSEESRGSNYLIANGACCIADEESLEMAISRIFGRLRYTRQKAGRLDLPEVHKSILKALVASPLSLDELAAFLKVDSMAALSSMSELVMKGLVKKGYDGRYLPSQHALSSLSAIVDG